MSNEKKLVICKIKYVICKRNVIKADNVKRNSTDSAECVTGT